ncbi:hypothetical protein [Coleofasciculus sp. FACHB-129]|uniref:hypothetical protein n=1 Tax=Cyanophyceae TaxID=3028117 RepID=UPI00168A33B8|nr:hypothetical protein [Coleofasciculus sp. FACHB-129]MBD1897733.1 hypothetical protein [Coleofasciculus sp. FACHB-129]
MTDKSSQIQIKETPKICAIDLDREIIDALGNRGLHCFPGRLGSQVKVPNSSIHAVHQCIPDCLFPPNLHEYDIVLVDMQQGDTIEYNLSNHQPSSLKGSNQIVLVSRYPETIFDPRPFSANFLGKQLQSIYKKESLIIVFSSPREVIEYHCASITRYGYQERESFEHNLYDLLPGLNGVYNKIGQNISIAPGAGRNIGNLLQKYSKNFIYEVIFNHPTKWLNNKSIKRDDFIPLLLNLDGEIVSFINFLHSPSITLVFPQLICNKKGFLLELIDDVLPEMLPVIFPYSEQFSWLKSNDYFLPNQVTLSRKKEKLEADYIKALAGIDKEIHNNQAKYKFLHNLLTETGDALVKAVEYFLNWLGFSNVVNMDETAPDIKEEDIQVSLEKGLLIVEVKGIGGTSKDSECSQISKIKYRRSKERGSFDVSALYLVNHQRYLPPKDRRNPPFTKHQIADAQSDERALLTTYELFKLYFAIEEGFVTPEDARRALLQYGLVTFSPSNAFLIGSPLEIHHKGKIAIIKIDKVSLCKGTKVIVCNDGIYSRAEILEIQIDGKTVESVSSGEIGVKFDCSILKTSELWLQQSNH